MGHLIFPPPKNPTPAIEKRQRISEIELRNKLHLESMKVVGELRKLFKLDLSNSFELPQLSKEDYNIRARQDSEELFEEEPHCRQEEGPKEGQEEEGAAETAEREGEIAEGEGEGGREDEEWRDREEKKAEEESFKFTAEDLEQGKNMP
jgi:hypothetical protein